MKTKELIALMQVLDPDGEMDVWVRGVGGIPYGNVRIKSAMPGFDWTHGQFVLHPEEPMRRVVAASGKGKR